MTKTLKKIKREIQDMPDVEDFVYEEESSSELPGIKTESGKYACDKCEYQAFKIRDVDRHIQAKHEGIKLPCNLCEHTYSFPSGLKRHQRKAHTGIIRVI